MQYMIVTILWEVGARTCHVLIPLFPLPFHSPPYPPTCKRYFCFICFLSSAKLLRQALNL